MVLEMAASKAVIYVNLEYPLPNGADGIAAINTIKSITGLNIHTYVAAPAVHGHSAVGGYPI